MMCGVGAFKPAAKEKKSFTDTETQSNLKSFRFIAMLVGDSLA